MVMVAEESVGVGESEPKGNKQKGNTERRPELEREKRQQRTEFVTTAKQRVTYNVFVRKDK